MAFYGFKISVASLAAGRTTIMPLNSSAKGRGLLFSPVFSPSDF